MAATHDAPAPYSLEEGRELVWGARHVVESATSSPRFERGIAEERLARFKERRGVFVTLEFYPTRALRGCIGFTEPIAPLGKLLVEAALAAATEDPRFVSVTRHELESLIVEVSILTEPQRITARSAKALPRQIRIGTDGLLIRYGYKSGLLLPIVAVEERWDAEAFLDNLCVKAGLAEHTWKVHDVELYRFSTQVFRETEPRGEIEEVVLK